MGVSADEPAFPVLDRAPSFGKTGAQRTLTAHSTPVSLPAATTRRARAASWRCAAVWRPRGAHVRQRSAARVPHRPALNPRPRAARRRSPPPAPRAPPAAAVTNFSVSDLTAWGAMTAVCVPLGYAAGALCHPARSLGAQKRPTLLPTPTRSHAPHFAPRATTQAWPTRCACRPHMRRASSAASLAFCTPTRAPRVRRSRRVALRARPRRPASACARVRVCRTGAQLFTGGHRCLSASGRVCVRLGEKPEVQCGACAHNARAHMRARAVCGNVADAARARACCACFSVAQGG
jgi:hypothetical protein